MSTLLFLLIACSTEPLTVPVDAPAPRELDVPTLEVLDTDTDTDTDTTSETEQASERVDPCDLSPMPPAVDVALSCGDFEVGDPEQGAPIDEALSRCDYPTGNYATYHVTEPATVLVHFCEPGGTLVVYDDNLNCYGYSRSPDGLHWGTYPLPSQTVGVTGARYWLEVDCS